MSTVDFIYLLLLVLSIPFGCVVRSCQSRLGRQWLCFASGISITLGLSGVGGSMHSFITVTGNYLLVRMCKASYRSSASFIFVFGYLLFYRVCSVFGFPQPGEYANAVQLVVTLRMISLSFEITDIYGENGKHGAPVGCSSEDNDYSSLTNKKENCHNDGSSEDCPVSFFDVLSYGYCYIGLLLGPFYTYKTFQDMLHQTYNESSFWSAVKNLKMLPFLLLVYLFLTEKFPLEDLQSEEFLNSSFSYSLYVITFTIMWCRWRFYIGFLFAESSCMSCGLGAYPVACQSKPGKGPTKQISVGTQPTFSPVQPDLQPLATASLPSMSDTEKEPQENKLLQAEYKTCDFETIHNIVISEVELGITMQDVMRNWNMTVQWWMATYIYKRLPFKSYYLKYVVTLSVSAFWHGIRPGYYLSFLSSTLMVFAQSNINQSLKGYVSGSTRYVFDWLMSFCLLRYIDYIAVPFMLLEFDCVWKIWSKMYFYGHLFVVIIIVLPMFIRRKKEKL